MVTKNLKPRITLSQIAQEVGLSNAAVSMALRGHKRISIATQEKVAAVADRLGYVHDRSAARLRTGQSDTIGIIISDISNPFFGELVAGIDESIDHTGKISFLFNTRDNLQRQEQLLIRLHEQGVDGLIICPAPGTDEHLFQQINTWGIPCVQMLRHVPEQHCDYVSADYFNGMKSLCEHLIQRGHTKIAYIGGNLDHSATSQRLEGFQASLQQHQLVAKAIIRSELTRKAGRKAIKTLLNQSAPPTAAVCYSDTIALGVLAGLADMNLQAGQDFAVTGFDDGEEAQESRPPLTTAASHARDIGKQAGRLLVHRMANPGSAPQTTIIPTDIIIRSTCSFSLTS